MRDTSTLAVTLLIDRGQAVLETGQGTLEERENGVFGISNRRFPLSFNLGAAGIEKLHALRELSSVRLFALVLDQVATIRAMSDLHTTEGLDILAISVGSDDLTPFALFWCDDEIAENSTRVPCLIFTTHGSLTREGGRQGTTTQILQWLGASIWTLEPMHTFKSADLIADPANGS